MAKRARENKVQVLSCEWHLNALAARLEMIIYFPQMKTNSVTFAKGINATHKCVERECADDADRAMAPRETRSGLLCGRGLFAPFNLLSTRQKSWLSRPRHRPAQPSHQMKRLPYNFVCVTSRKYSEIFRWLIRKFHENMPVTNKRI